MTVYINNVLQRTEILPSNTPTLDETLETFSFALISNDNPLPLAPMQKVRVYWDETNDPTDFTDFYLVSDSVETYSLNPVKYKHTITCIQNTRKLSKHLVRNSSFTQPFYLIKKSYNVGKRYSDSWTSGDDPIQTWKDEYTAGVPLNDNSEKLDINNKEIITKAKFVLSFQYGTGNSWANLSSGNLFAYDHNADDVYDRISNLTDMYLGIDMVNSFTLSYKDANNQVNTLSITPDMFGETEFDFNSSYNFPLIVELAKDGCKDFEILFDTKDMIIAHGNPSGVDSILIRWWAIQVSIEAEVYYYNCYDILELLLKRQQKETTLRSDAPLFALPASGELYDLLKKTTAPNFTFTQLTMYECVADVFRLFDAIFTMDENGVLGIEYFNDLSKQTITPKLTGRTLALGEDKYTNGLVAEYQDARTLENFPSHNNFAHVRSAELGIPSSSDHNFIVPHNIDTILKCEIIIDGLVIGYHVDSNNSDTTKSFDGSMIIDITRYVVDQSFWASLSTGDMTDQDYIDLNMKQSNTVYYEKGDNRIQLGASFKSSWGLSRYVLQNVVDSALIKIFAVGSHSRAKTFSTSTILRGDWKSIMMRTTYVTTIDGKTKTHSLTNKYDGDSLIDQENGAVDLNKMGLNMLGVTLKSGNPTLNATHRITSWANRIKTGQLYEYEGKLWIANVVNYTFFGNGLQGKISFVQNFNQLALRTKLLREKRMSSISKELVQKSEEIITDFVYYSTSLFDGDGDNIHFNKNYLKQFVCGSFDVVGPFDSIQETVIYFITDDPIVNSIAIYIPLVKYGAGNTINFEMSFGHPMNAGNRTIYENGGYYTDHVIYTDKDGFKNEFNIKAPIYAPFYDQNFPLVQVYPYDDAQNRGVGYFDIRGFKAYKQPNEIFALNYQLAFLPMPNRENIDFIGNEWINNNCFVKEFENGKNARYIVFMTSKSSNLDIKATDYFLKKEIDSVGLVGLWQRDYAFSLEFAFETITSAQMNATKSWAIVDSRDNILFASNTKPESDSYTTIYFMSKLNRLS